jgi:hypothetical protein
VAADEIRPNTITTSDRCPECEVVDITPRAGTSQAGAVQVWHCVACGFVFYRYRRALDGADADARRRPPPPIGGRAPTPPRDI